MKSKKLSLFKTSIFQRKSKKNDQSSVSEADREIPILGSTDNAGNSVNLVSGIIRLPSGWDFSILARSWNYGGVPIHLFSSKTLKHR